MSLWLLQNLDFTLFLLQNKNTLQTNKQTENIAYSHIWQTQQLKPQDYGTNMPLPNYFTSNIHNAYDTSAK